MDLKGVERVAVEGGDESRFYGAVSIGDVWKFGFLDRAEKRIVEDLFNYTLPKDLADIMRILVGALTE